MNKCDDNNNNIPSGQIRTKSEWLRKKYQRVPMDEIRIPVHNSKVVNNPETVPSRYFWKRMKLRWNGGRQLLPTTDSPTISTCTTSTNLSNLEFESSSSIHKFTTKSTKGMILEENLKTAIPEIEPLQTKNDLNINCSKQEIACEQLCQTTEQKFSVKWRKVVRQIIAAIAVSLVSMVIGYVSAYTSPAGISLEKDLEITKHEFSWISGLMPLMAVFGGLMGGPLIEYLGRKWTLLITDILFLISWLVNYFTQLYWHMYISRIVAGIGVGIATLTLPVYLGETIQPEIRGTLGLLPTALGNIGILVCFSMGNFFEWRGIAGIGALLPLPFLVLIWFIPETPRWYISKGKSKESRKALEWLRGKENKAAIDKELDDLEKIQTISDEKNDISDLFSKTNMKSLGIVLGLMLFQQMSGINAVIFYTTQIFKDSGSTMNASVQTTIVGAVNFISTFIATILIDRLGRRVLLYISSVAMIITLAILGTYFYLLNVAQLDLSAYGWIPLATSIIYVLGFSLGFGPVPWLMMGEILPAKIRGPAASLCTGFNWTCTFIVTKTFPLFKDSMGPYGVFWMFGAITLVGLLFTIKCVPETRGQSLEDIERRLAGVKTRRNSIANLKALPASTC